METLKTETEQRMYFTTEPMTFTITIPEIKIKTTEGDIVIKYQPKNEETK